MPTSAATSRVRRLGAPALVGLFVMTLCAPVSLAAAARATYHGVASAHSPARAELSLRLSKPAGLALAPGGNLFIADEALNEVIVRLPSGQLHVVAGTGQAGFSGDGGISTSAELDGPSYLARSDAGTLYVGVGDRVREILPDAIITTFAGDGSGVGAGTSRYAVGTPATKVAVQPGGLAVGPNGDIYVATGDDVLEISVAGVIVRVINLDHTPGVTMRSPTCDPRAIAVDAQGDLVLGCNSRELIERLASGHFIVVTSNYRPHDFAGMAFTVGGALLFSNGESLRGEVEDNSTTFINLSTFGPEDVFVPSGVAVAGNGTIFTDSQSGDGFSSGAGLAKVTPGGRPVLLRLWKGR